MAEIKILDYQIGADQSTITVDKQSLPIGIKLKKALVTLKTNTTLYADDVYHVKCSVGNEISLVDTIHSITSGDILRINVTDELQRALDTDESLIINFEKVDSATANLTFSKPSDDEYKVIPSDIEYISKASYSANGTSHSIDLGTAGQASVNLNTGTLNLTHQDVQSDSNVLPLSIAHVYNSFGTKLPTLDDENIDTGISNHYGKGWKLNLEQYLVEKTKDVDTSDDATISKPNGEYEYFDENGKKQIIVEKYYYTTTNENGGNNKQYVERTDPKLSMNLEGELQYHKDTGATPEIVPIETEWEAASGLKLVTKKSDIKGASLVDTEPDELLQLREQLKQYTLSKKSIDNNIKSNKEQLCYMALAKKAFVDQIAIQLDSIKLNKNQVDYQVDNRNLLYAYAIQSIDGAQYVDWGRIFLDNINKNFDNTQVQDIISRALGNNKSIPQVNVNGENKTLTESDMAFVLRYFNDTKNLTATWNSIQNLSEAWDKSSTTNEAVDECDMKTQLNMVNKNNTFYNTTIDQDDINVFLNDYLGNQVVNNLKLAETVSNLFNQNNINSSYTLTLGSKDILSLDIQVQSLIDNILLSQEQLEDYVKNITKLNNQIHAYERQIPQFYLYSNNVIYGFSPIITETEVTDTTTSEITYTTIPHIYRLNYIADTYENSIVINYEKNTNKIENIIDSQDNVITFEYKTVKTDNSTEEERVIITDAQDKQVTFVLQAGRLAKVKYNDDTTSQYLYDSNSKLIAAIGANGIGAKFTYDGNNVTEIQEITTLENIENGKDTPKGTDFTIDGLDNLKTDAPFIKIDYKDYDSTSISTLKAITTESNQTTIETIKGLIYVFDNDGRVRTVYENSFIEKTYEISGEETEKEDPNANPFVKSFEYVADKKQIAVEPLLNSINFMDDVCFTGNAVVQMPANYFGNGLLEGDEIYCGDDIYCESYPVHMQFHAYTTADTDFNKFLTVSTTHLTEINNLISDSNRPQTRLILGGWAKADSAFVLNPDNVGDIENYPTYIQNRKFELRAEVTYTGKSTSVTFSKCFDWLNTDWQYCAVPIEFDKSETVAEIKCYFDYSNNTITESTPVYFTDLTLKEASYEERTYNDKLLTEVISSHSKWRQVYEYDDNDKLTKLLYYYDTTNSDAEPLVNEFYYNKNGKLFKTIDYKGIVTEKVFNENGIEIQTKKYHKDNPAEIMFTEQKLGEKGEVLADYNELGEEINSYEYVAGTGVISTIADKQGNKTAYGYDTRNGTLLQMTSDVDNISNTNTYGYTLGFLTKVSHNDFDITYDYDSRGRVSKIKVAGNDYLSFTYDDATNSATASYCKKEDENTILFNTFRTVTDKNGNVTEVYFRPTALEAEICVLQNIYDTHGNLIAVNDKITNATTKYTLDKFGNTTLQTDTQHSLNVQKENTFDAQNNNTVTKYTIGTDTQNYTYSYDVSKPNSVLNSVILPTGATQSVANDNLDRTHEISLTSGDKKTTRLFHYLKNGDHTSNQVSSIWFGDNNKYLDNLKYKYDEKGNITEVYENSILQVRYKYDSLSRIIREDNKPLSKTTTWEYDAGGNITNRFEYAFTIASDLSDKTPTIIPYSYATSGIRDKLMEYNGEEFVYDSIGNPTTYRGKALQWSHGRQLDTYGDIASYTYNASGIRTSKTAGSTTTQYYLDGTKVLAQKDIVSASESTTTATFMQFIYGVDGIIGFTLNDTNYYYKKNLQGDVIGIYNNNLQLIAKYTYDAWGNHKISYLENGVFVDFIPTNSYNESNTSLYVALKNPFRYRSYYYDTETGLYYLNSRYYDPETGRFINIDDIGIINESKDLLNGLNLFIYCNDNPIMFTDKSGHDWWHWLIGAIIIIAAAALTIITAGGFAAAGTAFAGALGIGNAVGGAAGFFAAATVGAVIGATAGMAIGGFSSVVNGGNFWDGAANGFMWGTISGFISGGLSFFKFGGIGNFGPRQQFNKLQIISQMLSNYAVYGIKSAVNNEKPTILGSLLTLFGGIAGGMVAYLKLPEQIFVTTSLEIENLLVDIIKKIWDLPENIFI